jgi:hypothetical protein
MSLRIKKGGSEYHSRQGDGGTWLATRTPKNGEEEKIDDVGGWDEETKEAFEKVFKANQEGNKPPSKESHADEGQQRCSKQATNRPLTLCYPFICDNSEQLRRNPRR